MGLCADTSDPFSAFRMAIPVAPLIVGRTAPPVPDAPSAPLRPQAPPTEARRPTLAARLRRLLDINLVLNTYGDTDRLLEVIVDTVTTVADCEAASILLFDEEAGALRFEAASGDVGPSLVGTTVPLAGSIAGAIFCEDRPLYAPDVRSDARHCRRVDDATGFQTRGLLGVPMRIDGRPVGVIEALNSRHSGFDGDDAEALLVVAAQAAVAIRDARHEQALVQLNERLGQLDRLKTNFLAITSHELRTPLTSVRGFGQILAEEVREPLRPYADAVVRAGYRMTDVVETLDVMATLDGEIGAHPGRRVELKAILLEAVRALGEAHGDVLVSFPDGLVTEGDGLRLRLAFNNLLKNAVQFSPTGASIYVDGSVEGRVVHIRVTDEGRGIDPEDLERIFDPYVQVEDADHRDHEGLGVGLTVARAVAVQHGGQLWAESVGPGYGATFHLTLPLTR